MIISDFELILSTCRRSSKLRLIQRPNLLLLPRSNLQLNQNRPRRPCALPVVPRPQNGPVPSAHADQSGSCAGSPARLVVRKGSTTAVIVAKGTTFEKTGSPKLRIKGYSRLSGTRWEYHGCRRCCMLTVYQPITCVMLIYLCLRQ